MVMRKNDRLLVNHENSILCLGDQKTAVVFLHRLIVGYLLVVFNQRELPRLWLIVHELTLPYLLVSQRHLVRQLFSRSMVDQD